MAPAIAHFLVGASLCLGAAIPLTMRGDLDPEHAIWAIPLGGIWGIAPDLHNIAPVYVDGLYALHGTPWMDLFGVHYTLDRSAIRVRYHASVFGAISLFTVAVAAFWGMGRSWTDRLRHDRGDTPLAVIGIAALIATGLATSALWIAVSVQTGFETAAGLVGRSTTLAGGVVVIACGLAGGLAWTLGTEGILGEPTVGDPRTTTGVGAVLGVVTWVGGVFIAVPLAVSVPSIQLGSLGALVVYGSVFGGVYGLSRGAFTAV